MDESIEKTEIHSCSFFLVFLTRKSAIQKLNALMQFAASKRKDAYNIWILGAGIAVKETIQLFAVSVKVNDEPYLSLFAYLLNKCLDWCHLRTILIFLCDVPVSIEILACQVCPVMSENNSIRIDHRHNVNYVIFQ